MTTTRRQFLRTTTIAGAAVGFPSIIPASVLGKEDSVAPSNRVNVGVIACGDQSGAAGAYTHYPKSQIVAVCDPVLERRQAKAAAWGVKDQYNDFRDLLARGDIDAVHIATADHWHVPISLAAARAGKDIYCEKPLGISIEQDLASREIVEKHHRVFQYGTQQRSQTHMRLGIELVLNGHIGDVKEVYVWAPQGASGGSATPVIPIPEGFDYDVWLGPAPEAPFCKDRCLPDRWPKGIWHIYDYAIGFIAGWGAHPVDQLQWWADAVGLGLPVEYKATGTIPSEGLFNTVTHWDMECAYANGIRMYFADTETIKMKPVPGLDQLKGFGNCTVFVGDKGWVGVSREGWVTSSEELRRKGKDPGPIKLALSTHHQQNFIDSVISRQQPVATLDSAVRSDIICHMGDIAIRTGEALRWDPTKETVVGSSDAVKMMHRPMREPWTL